MSMRFVLAAASLMALGSLMPEAGAQGLVPYQTLKPGDNPNYHVNQYGYGNYVQGPDGSIGGYPAGSSGARQLQIYQELKCRYTPESC